MVLAVANLLAFQSLIGRLKTSANEAIRSAAPEFQSLIGRLKTQRERRERTGWRVGFNPS